MPIHNNCQRHKLRALLVLILVFIFYLAEKRRKARRKRNPKKRGKPRTMKVKAKVKDQYRINRKRKYKAEGRRQKEIKGEKIDRHGTRTHNLSLGTLFRRTTRYHCANRPDSQSPGSFPRWLLEEESGVAAYRWNSIVYGCTLDNNSPKPSKPKLPPVPFLDAKIYGKLRLLGR